MKAKDFAKELRELIEGIKAKGNETIVCDALITYLANYENTAASDPTPLEVEQFKLQMQSQMEQVKRAHEGQLEMFRSVISSGQAAIKTGFLLNGGASIAMLAFIGHLSENSAPLVPQFSLVLVPFTIGVLLSAVLSGVTYLSQWLYASPQPSVKRAGFAANIGCIFLGLLNYGMFAWGLCRAYDAFRSFS